MRARFSAFAALRGPTVLGLVAAVVGAGLLAACSSTSAERGKIADRMFGKKLEKGGVVVVDGEEYDADFFLKSGFCPPVNIRPGAEVLVLYQRNHENEPDFVTFQGSITKTARECNPPDAETMAIKLGVAGRVVAGPKGSAGDVTLPLRVAVVKQHGGNILYTEEFRVPVTVSGPDFGADFSQVIDQIVFNVTPDDRDLIVFVGFDQGPPPTG